MKTFFKPIYLVAIAIALTFIINSCKQNELGEVGFPRVRTLHVEMISDTGAVFKGELLDIPPDCEILDYGFCWSEYIGATVSLDKISLGKTKTTGVFEGAANRAMVAGRKYYFKAYVQTPTLTIYGNELDFVSLGSNAPVISTISPNSGSWEDTITIKGKYFSSNTYHMQVYFGKVLGMNVKSSDNEIKTLVPMDLDTSQCKISIKYNNVVYPSEEVFTLVPNVSVTSIEPASGSWNTTVKIRGKNLGVTQKLLFNKSMSTLISKSDSLLIVKVPSGLDTVSSRIVIEVNKFIIGTPDKFTLLPSQIIEAYPNPATKGTFVGLKGKNLRGSNQKIIINQKEATIISKTDTLISFIMPEFENEGIKSLYYEDQVFKYNPTPINYLIPNATSFPTTYTWGDTVTFEGSGFNLLTNPKVFVDDSFGKKYLQIISVTDKLIKVVMPNNNYNDKIKIQIEYGNSNTTLGELTLSNPFIDEVSYDKNNPSLPIIIRGRAFHTTWSKVYISNPQNPSLQELIELEVISRTPKEIRCKYPSIVSDSYQLQVKNELWYYYGKTYSSNKINAEFVSPFKVYFNLPKYIYRVLTNNNEIIYFQVSNGKNIFKFDLNSKSITTINSTYPDLYNSARFQIGSKGYFFTGDTVNQYNSAASNHCYTYDIIENKWERIANFPGEKRTNAYGFSINSKGYIIGGMRGWTNFNDMWEYDSLNKCWTQLLMPNSSMPYATVFTSDNAAYFLISGTIYKYTPGSNSLETEITIPYSNSYHYPMFYYNQKAYILNGSEIFEYNFQTKIFKSVIKTVMGATYFYFIKEYNGKIYLESNNQIIEFDPSYLK